MVFGRFHVDLRGISHIARLEHLALGEPSPAYSTVVSLARPRPNYVTTEGGEEIRDVRPRPLASQRGGLEPGGLDWNHRHFTTKALQSNEGEAETPKIPARTFFGASWRKPRGPVPT